MRLLDKSFFAPIFEDLRGLRVGIVDGFGNVGDDLLYLATRRFCREFGVDYFTVNALAEDTIPSCDKLLLLLAGMWDTPSVQRSGKGLLNLGYPVGCFLSLYLKKKTCHLRGCILEILLVEI